MKTTEIFQHNWARGSQHAFTTDWLRVWRHRAAQIREGFRRDLRHATNVFAARLAALDEENA